MALTITASIFARSPTAPGPASSKPGGRRRSRRRRRGSISTKKKKVSETVARLHTAFDADTLDVSCWPLVKSAYITLIDLRFDDELSETWYNSIFCGLFSHDLISDGCMFIHTTRPSLRRARAAQTRTYKPQGQLSGMLASIFADYRFSEDYADLPGDLRRLEAQLRENLPGLGVQGPWSLASSCFPRCCTATRVRTWWGASTPRDEQWPLVIPLLHLEGRGHPDRCTDHRRGGRVDHLLLHPFVFHGGCAGAGGVHRLPQAHPP